MTLPKICNRPEWLWDDGRSIRAEGWVAGKRRTIEIFDYPQTVILAIDGAGRYFIDSNGKTIGKLAHHQELTPVDYEVILGPVLVFALALHRYWCLHASAALFEDEVIVFLGDSGRGKSTLGRYLTSGEDRSWRLVADDILPVTQETSEVIAWTRFPQLKLPVSEQPGCALPEKLPFTKVCLLAPTAGDPELRVFSQNQSIQALLSHTAGTRLFSPELLSKHLDFCAHAAEHVTAYRLEYPHRKEALPEVKALLEGIC